METIKKLLSTLFNHERYQTIAGLLACAAIIWFYGCESKVSSLSTPEKQITRAELQTELETLLSSAEIRFAQLDQQDLLKQTLAEQAFLIAQTGAINPLGIATAIMALFGVGATVDNIRKRKEIKILSP